jgi:hypothetical protein
MNILHPALAQFELYMNIFLRLFFGNQFERAQALQGYCPVPGSIKIHCCSSDQYMPVIQRPPKIYFERKVDFPFIMF